MRFLSCLFVLFFASLCLAANPEKLRSFGKESPVKLYLFTSLGCSHCATFHKQILPELKKMYVDSGKAQLIIVDMLRGRNSLTATQAVRCLDGINSERLEDDLYAHQSNWMDKSAPDADKVIFSYASKQGMSQKSFDECITNKELQKTIIEQQVNMARLYDIKATPILVIRDGSEVSKWTGSDKKVIMDGLKEAFQK